MLWKGLTVPSLAGADLHGHLDGTVAAPDKTIKEDTDKRMGDFFRYGEPEPVHQNDAYVFLLFQLFNRKPAKALHRTYKPEPANIDVKAPPI
jgi:hypothetical protein